MYSAAFKSSASAEMAFDGFSGRIRLTHRPLSLNPDFQRPMLTLASLSS